MDQWIILVAALVVAAVIITFVIADPGMRRSTARGHHVDRSEPETSTGLTGDRALLASDAADVASPQTPPAPAREADVVTEGEPIRHMVSEGGPVDVPTSDLPTADDARPR